jgi:hypothetical protein
MKYTLIINDQLTLEEIHTQVQNGARFKIFPYCISVFIAITLKRLSPAILITSAQQEQFYKKKYNRISYIFGWWGIPWGIQYTLNYSRLNNKGGIDVTDEIMLNITSESVKNKTVYLKLSAMVFIEPQADIDKAFTKVIRKMSASDSALSQVVVGRYLHVENHEHHHYIIGLKRTAISENQIESFIDYSELLKKELYREFSKTVTFDVVDIAIENELMLILMKQGKQYFIS